MKADSVIIYVDDFECSKAFYGGALGLKMRLDAGNYCEFDIGGLGLGLMSKKALPYFLGETGREQWKDGAPRCELYFIPDNVEEAVKKIEAAGAQKVADLKLMPWGDEAAYYRDPDGHIIALARRTHKFYELNKLS